MFKKAINLGPDSEISLFQNVKNAGFDGCDIGLDAAFMNDKHWEEKICRLKETLDNLGLECVQVHLPFYDIFLSSEIIQDDMKTALLRSMKAMHLLDCKWGAYHPRTAFNHKYSPEVSMKDNYNEISIYLEEAVKYDVGIAIENLAIFPECPQHKFFTADYNDLNALAESFHSDNIGVCWDFGHANLMPALKQDEAFQVLGDKIKLLHIHNNSGTHDDHIMPSLGTVNWKTILPALRKSGYKGDFALEVKYYNMWDEIKSYYDFGYDCLRVFEKHFHND